MHIVIELKKGLALGLEYIEDSELFLVILHLGFITVTIDISNDPSDPTAY
jgi:hypothetical protein